MTFLKVILIVSFLEVPQQLLSCSKCDSSGLNFCGEIVPFSINKVEKEYKLEMIKLIHRFSLNLATKRRINVFFPIATAILRHYEIPDDFKYLMLEESGLINSFSRKGAYGYWQIMSRTAKDFGLRIGKFDERGDLYKSTNMACWYLRKLYNEFGSWTLTAAAYNEGPGRLKREIKLQRTNNYYLLKLNSETRSYLYKIVSLKYLYKKN